MESGRGRTAHPPSLHSARRKKKVSPSLAPRAHPSRRASAPLRPTRGMFHHHQDEPGRLESSACALSGGHECGRARGESVLLARRDRHASSRPPRLFARRAFCFSPCCMRQWRGTFPVPACPTNGGRRGGAGAWRCTLSPAGGAGARCRRRRRRPGTARLACKATRARQAPPALPHLMRVQVHAVNQCAAVARIRTTPTGALAPPPANSALSHRPHLAPSPHRRPASPPPTSTKHTLHHQWRPPSSRAASGTCRTANSSPRTRST